MALKEMISSWDDGVKAYESGNYTTALQHFHSISDPSAKIYFNLSCVSAKLGRSRDAIKNLTEAVDKDQHFPLGYYQRGLHYFKLQQYDRAVDDFDKAIEKMHGREVIDYSQLGMTYKLYAVEIWLSMAAIYEKKGYKEEALQVIVQASKTIDADDTKQQCVEAIHMIQGGHGHLQLSELPDTCLFHPSKEHLANLQKRQYVAKAKVVSSYPSDTDDINDVRTIRRSPSPARRNDTSDQSKTWTSSSRNELQVPDHNKKANSMPVDYSKSGQRPRLLSGPPARPLPTLPQSDGQTSHKPLPSPPQHGGHNTHRLPPDPPKSDIVKSKKPSLPLPKNDTRVFVKPPAAIPSNERQNGHKRPPMPLPQSASNGRRRSQPPIPDVKEDKAMNSLQSELSSVLSGQLQKLNSGCNTRGTQPEIGSNRSPNTSKKPPRPPPPCFSNDEDIPPPLPRKDYRIS